MIMVVYSQVSDLFSENVMMCITKEFNKSHLVLHKVLKLFFLALFNTKDKNCRKQVSEKVALNQRLASRL